MRLSLVIRPLDDSKLKIANQIGVTDITASCPGYDLDSLKRLQDRISDAGLRLSVIEDDLPLEEIVLAGPRRREQLDQLCQVIRNMGSLGIDVLCYNFMPKNDATRTSFVAEDRGGALVSAFDIEQVKDLPAAPGAPTTSEQQWANLAWLLERIVPVAADAGVKLAMHPDDPPIPMLRGHAHILHNAGSFDRLLELADDPANGITFCQGCFSEMQEDIPRLIRRWGNRIHFVHFRDVVGCPTNFREAFQDTGQTDMPAAMRAYRDIGFSGPARPDHVPLLHGEAGIADGYSFLGRLWAIGYMKGLYEAVNSEARRQP